MVLDWYYISVSISSCVWSYLIPETQWLSFLWLYNQNHSLSESIYWKPSMYIQGCVLGITNFKIKTVPVFHHWYIKKLHQCLKNQLNHGVLNCYLPCITNDFTSTKHQRALNWFLYCKLMHLFLMHLKLKTLWTRKLHFLQLYVRWQSSCLISKLVPEEL